MHFEPRSRDTLVCDSHTLAGSPSQGGADCAAGGVTSDGTGWAEDMFLSDYAPCDTTTSPPTGVCPDRVFRPGAASGVNLLAASRVGGVTTVVMRRPLAAGDNATDVAITVDSDSWVWAHGPLLAGPGQPGMRLQPHGQSENEYGPLRGLKLSSCSPQCAPLPQSTEVTAAPAQSGFRGPVRLAGGGVSVQWKLMPVDGVPGVVLRFDSLRSCGWASVAVGSQMVGSHAYVAWQADPLSPWRVDGYDMSSLDAAGIARTSEKLLGASGSGAPTASGVGGLVSATFWRPLAGGAGAPPLDASSVPLVWALGSSWADPPRNTHQHFDRSGAPTIVNLLTGESSVGAPPPPARTLVAHAVLMVVSYAGLMPLAVASARYLRAGGVVPTPGWFSAHRAVALASVAVALAGVATALAYQKASRGSVDLLSSHSRQGVAAVVLMSAQPLNALLRPKPDPPGATGLTRRRGWEVAHRVIAAAAAGVAIAALFSGIDLSCLRGFRTCEDQKRGLVVWLALLAGYVLIRETATALMLLPGAGRYGWSGVSGKDSPVPSEDSSGEGARAAGGDVEAAAAAAAGAQQDAASRRLGVQKARFERTWGLAGVAWLAAAIILSILVAAGVIGGTGPAVIDAGGGAAEGGAPAPEASAPAAAQAPPPSSAAIAPRPPGPPLQSCPLTPAGAAQLSRLGDGWCDAGYPHNSADCGFDGGDCCDTTKALFDCQDPSSPYFGRSSAKGLRIPAPTNPRYADPGRAVSSYAFVSTFNNFYEAR